MFSVPAMVLFEPLKMHARPFGNFKLTTGVCDRVNFSTWFCDELVTCPRVSPCRHPMTAGGDSSNGQPCVYGWKQDEEVPCRIEMPKFCACGLRFRSEGLRPFGKEFCMFSLRRRGFCLGSLASLTHLETQGEMQGELAVGGRG